MAILMQIENLSKSVGDRMLFADMNLGINEGDKIGIIAKNGAGKSTMLRIIAGDEDYDSGKITLRNGVRVGYLDQDSAFDPGLGALDACLAASPPPEREIHADEGSTYRQQLISLLSSLGIEDLGQKTGTMSGGQIKRLAIAATLVSQPDIILLDEPTNHLDIEVIEWLENYLRRSRATLMMVTHDRYFLDRVCNKIIEIDREAVYYYDGNYDYFLRRRTERIEAMSAELARVKNTLRREQEWINATPQARTGKAKYRIDRYHELKQKSLVRLGERQVSLGVNKDTYIGSKIFEASHICKRYGDKVILDDFSYIFARHEKVGIIGPNGVGKSTMIKMLLGIEPQDSGVWDIGQTVRFGYYSQDGIQFDESKKVIDAVTEYAEDIDMGGGVHISPLNFLQRFLFSVPDQQKYIYKLSGGERRRLYLATVLMRNPNFLILDEPTNDLDIVTLGLLEQYLADFNGCVIVVSHDRYFLDKIVDHIFVLEGDGVVRDFPGTYTEYHDWRSQQAAASEPKTEKSAPAKQRTTDRKRKLSFKEQREFESLDSEIASLTEEKDSLEALFNSGQVVTDIAAKAERYEQVKELLDLKETRWLELSLLTSE